MRAGTLTCRALVENYLRRIDAYDKNGPAINAIVVVNPAALRVADSLDDALESLTKFEPQLAQVIELHYFGGMTYEEIAAAIGSSAATVHRHIRLARAWLLDEIEGKRPA